MWPNFLVVVSLLCLAFFAWAKAGPVPIVNEVSGRQGADGARRKRSSTAGGTNLGQWLYSHSKIKWMPAALCRKCKLAN